MSCSCCNHLSGREKLLHEISTEEEEEEVWRMDVSDLRQQYRSCRERHQEVLLFGTVSEERFEAFSIVPVAQGLTLPWEPISSFSSTITFDCNPKMYDPWHVHLDLHRRSRPAVSAQSPVLSRSTPSSKSRTREPSGSPSSSIETSSCVFSAQEERVCTELQFYGRPGSGQVQDSPQQDPSEGVPDSSLEADVTNPEETPTLDSFCPHLNAEKQEQNRSSGWCSALVLTRRFGRQLSEGGVCSPSQNPFPFPSRRPPRLSEAARRLGLYSP
ncbi:uncharacterized protein LOC112150983 isoform X2 [Oryzias melastigma]|uniref:uncharacterized protein LOC112150983 isoform X2 n=1 Tax=Oryzias melastigma TaxID=30732 RepID=UPI00168CF3DB|nr:uncharacterized protein LOC112150983 isoform X2 [Oryzias melastigma]